MRRTIRVEITTDDDGTHCGCNNIKSVMLKEVDICRWWDYDCELFQEQLHGSLLRCPACLAAELVENVVNEKLTNK